MLQLIAAGGNIYYLAKFAGMFGLDVQDIGAQQTGVSKAGSQGIELTLWLTARAALGAGAVREVASAYHVPISNTAAGMMLLEPTG